MNGDYLDHCCSEADRAQERIAEGYERLLRAALRVHREGNEAAPNPLVVLEEKADLHGDEPWRITTPCTRSAA